MTILLARREVERLQRAANTAKAKGDRPLYLELRRAMLNAQARLWNLTRGTNENQRV
jgi:hypothetical protein